VASDQLPNLGSPAPGHGDPGEAELLEHIVFRVETSRTVSFLASAGRA
jgi:hypothetical protein